MVRSLKIWIFACALLGLSLEVSAAEFRFELPPLSTNPDDRCRQYLTAPAFVKVYDSENHLIASWDVGDYLPRFQALEKDGSRVLVINEREVRIYDAKMPGDISIQPIQRADLVTAFEITPPADRPALKRLFEVSSGDESGWKGYLLLARSEAVTADDLTGMRNEIYMKKGYFFDELSGTVPHSDVDRFDQTVTKALLSQPVPVRMKVLSLYEQHSFKTLVKGAASDEALPNPLQNLLNLLANEVCSGTYACLKALDRYAEDLSTNPAKIIYVDSLNADEATEAYLYLKNCFGDPDKFKWTPNSITRVENLALGLNQGMASALGDKILSFIRYAGDSPSQYSQIQRTLIRKLVEYSKDSPRLRTALADVIREGHFAARWEALHQILFLAEKSGTPVSREIQELLVDVLRREGVWRATDVSLIRLFQQLEMTENLADTAVTIIESYLKNSEGRLQGILRPQTLIILNELAKTGSTYSRVNSLFSTVKNLLGDVNTPFKKELERSIALHQALR